MSKKKKLFWFELIGVVLVSAFAFLFHSLYEWSNGNFLIGMIAPTNESVFQHTKILFFPFLIYSIFEYFFIAVNFKRYFTVKALVAVALAVMVIVFHYTYSGIIGYPITAVDISLTFLCAIIAGGLSYWLLTKRFTIPHGYIISLVLLILTTLSMFVFTVYPPKIMLFFDTLHQTYLPYLD